VFKEVDSWLRGFGFKPPLKRSFFMHHSFGAKAWSKKEIMVSSNLPGIVACAGIPLMGV
jgi:hypothetical protein